MLRALPPITNTVARYFLVGGKTCNFAIQLVLQQRWKTSCTLVVARFTTPSRYVPVPGNPNIQTEMKTEVFMNPETAPSV